MAAVLHFVLWQLRLRAAASTTTRAERDTLAARASGRLRAVEIGVAQGVTTKRIRAAMAPEGELWAIDPYFPNRLGLRFSEMIARREVEGVENGRVRWVRDTGRGAAELWQAEGKKPADFVFIDADHTWQGISEDWQAWSDLVGAGAFIALHDSRSTPENPIVADSVRFTDSVVRTDPRFRIVAEVDSLTVVERLP